MHIVRLMISGFRGVRSADITLGRHAVLVAPNNSGKTTVVEALALLFGRDRLVRRLTEHDFHGSAPDESARILCIATVTGFTPNDPQHHSSWFSPERGVEKWYDPNAKTLSAAPDAQHIRAALTTLQTKQHTRKNGTTFGPYPHTWDRHDHEEADALLAGITLPQSASCADLRVLLTPLAGHAPIAQAINRMDRLRRTHGHAAFTAVQVIEFVRESVRNRSRLGFRQQQGHLAMTIQRAKNREFPNVIVLWPHTATGSAEHLRRLLYNGITRAQNHCTVIVIGQNRLNSPPFAP